MRVDGPQIVNDIHSRLNPTPVAGIAHVRDTGELCSALRHAADRNLRVSICGGRHAMGGQQFGRDTLLLDMTGMHRALRFDSERGLIEFEAGADWRHVIAATHRLQTGSDKVWGIRQKQTGADALTLGGAVSANIHGRGLAMRPFVDDVESFTLVTADAEVITCSRDRHRELFVRACGGYGLFGVIATVTLRLGPRYKLRRLVDILDIDDAIPAARRRAAEGCLYGDFQYAIDPADDSFLRRGVCACYKAVASDTPVSDSSADLCEQDWGRLLSLAHTDKRRAFEMYSAHYLATHGRVYLSDTMQLSTYIPTYDQFLKEIHAQNGPESLVIGELYVPPDALVEFLTGSRRILRDTGVEDIYGTIRSILRDETTFLPWARSDYACVIFNLRTRHDSCGVGRSARTFRALHDAAISLAGSFYVTYHRFASREQIESCYPQMVQFLASKHDYDPTSRFSSDWYRHLQSLFT